MIQFRPLEVGDFPVGCVVVPADAGEAAKLRIPVGTKGVIVAHVPPLLVVWWEGKTRPGSHDQWVPSHFRKIADMPVAADEDPDGNLVLDSPIQTAPPTAPAPTPDLKRLNTDGRTHCAGCGAELKDPGMGPSFRHCPACEP